MASGQPGGQHATAECGFSSRSFWLVKFPEEQARPPGMRTASAGAPILGSAAGAPGVALLRQPGGFKGFGPLCVLVHADDLAVAQRVDRIEAGLDLDPASSAAPPVVGGQEYAVPGVDQLLDCHVKFFPRALPMLEVVPDCVQAVRRPLLRGV